MPVFATVEDSYKPASAYRLARASEYAADLRLRRPSHKRLTFGLCDLLNYTDSSRKHDMDDFDETWYMRAVEYLPIRDAATLQRLIQRYRTDTGDIDLLTPYRNNVSRWKKAQGKEIEKEVSTCYW